MRQWGRIVLVLLLLAFWFGPGCSSQVGPTPVLVALDDGLAQEADGGTLFDYVLLDAPLAEEEVPSCSTNEECTPLYCDKDKGKCVECLINSHCKPAFRCEEGKCVKKENGCEGDAECSVMGLVCDEEKGECVECQVAQDCPAQHYCLQGKCFHWVCTPGAEWCVGSKAMKCADDGSAVVSEVECDDFNKCTIGDGCVNGQCQDPQPIDCDDGNPCTDDFCDPAFGCYTQFNDAACDDGTACTVGDKCENGVCVPGRAVCECESTSDCVAMEDGDLCNGTLICVDGFCKVDEASVVECEPSENPCKENVCLPDVGKCVLVNLPDGVECDDSNECTSEDKCEGGVCKGVKVSCDDGNPCTKDLCNSAKGCLFLPQAGECDDGDPCTWPDKCIDGVCMGTPLDCEDGNPCTKNWCEPGKGCAAEKLTGPCDDGDLCTEGDQCVDGICVGKPVVCQDDGNPCTNDYCDKKLGCVHEPNDLPCDDGDKCTLNDMCKNGKCVPGETLVNCDDGNPCTTDICDSESGECLHEANTEPCDDGDPCTVNDVCIETICVPGIQKNCDDGNPCTDDFCDKQGVCKNPPINGPCDDGNKCTQGDTCFGGVCQPGTPVKCDDGNPCTDDSCDPNKGCVNIPNANPCSDNNACTVNDVCSGGNCVPGAPLDCDDKNICTDDSCDPLTGCQNIPNSLPCDDGDACTTGDYCTAGVCLKGKPIICDDKNPCTDDFCDPKLGCQSKPNENNCEDGDPCTKGDICSGGTCVSGPVMDCDDGNPCTEDKCDFDKCLYLPVNGECDDGEPCTVNDKCNEGLCIGTLIANCGCHSLLLDGTTGCGVVPYSPLLNPTGDFTIELWFLQSDAGAYTLLSRWAESSKSFLLYVEGNGTVKFRLLPENGQKVAEVKNALSSLAGWHHAAVVLSGSALSLYLDGKLADTETVSGKMSPSTLPLFIGAPQVPPADWDGPGHFKGNLDEIRFSAAALYSGDTFEPPKKLAVLDSTIAFWGADQDQLTTLFDTSGNYLHADLKEGTSWSLESPAAVCTPVPNYPPSTPVISIQPPNPTDNDELVCIIDQPAIDLENDAVSYSFKWYLNGVIQPEQTTATVPASATADCPHWMCDQCQKWTCEVIASDGKPGFPASVSVTVGEASCKTCDGTLFADHCYKYNDWATSWGNASETCQQWGGHLVTISSAEENSFVDELCPGDCWIGLSDQIEEGSFIWVTGEKLSDTSYTNWKIGQPTNWLKDQDCVRLEKGLFFSGQWNDVSCNSQVQFTCEMEP